LSDEDVIIVDDVLNKDRKSEKRRKRKEKKVARAAAERESVDVAEKNKMEAECDVRTSKKQKKNGDVLLGTCSGDVQVKFNGESPSLKQKKRQRSKDEDSDVDEKLKKKQVKKDCTPKTQQVYSGNELEVMEGKRKSKKKIRKGSREDSSLETSGVTNGQDNAVSDQVGVGNETVRKKSKSKKSRRERCKSPEAISD